MAQQKKTGYYLHSPLTNRIGKFLKKGGLVSKKATTKECLQRFMEDQPELVGSLEYFILAEELFWRRQGREIIFPHSAEVLESLQKAKFNLGQDGLPGIEMPFKSFMIAFPKGYEPEPGVTLRPILVTWEGFADMIDTVFQPFTRWLDAGFEAEAGGIGPHKEGERALSIITCLEPTSLQYMRTLLVESDLPKVLSAQTPEEFRELASDYRAGGMEKFMDLEPQDLKAQFYAFRIACAMAVFNQATDGAFLKEGFPDQRAPRILEGDALKQTHHFTLQGTPAVHASPEEHYRSWHFRQLRDDRYYQGEHKSKPKGSRWVFVSDATVGAKTTPHTQELG